jgi:integrase
MATLVKTPAGRWKALIRRTGWPPISKTFRTKRDAEDWARTSEDEMVRGLYVRRASAEKLTVSKALDRYLKEVTPTKKPSTQQGEVNKAKLLIERLGDYALAAVTPDLVADYRDSRLAEGKANNTVRLELALLGHMYTVAIREWRLGLVYNPVTNIRKPSPGNGRNRRLTKQEESRLLEAVDQHSNPMLGWIVRIALYTGMRKGEIVSLRHGQVDLQKRLVMLTDTKNGSARNVPLTRPAVSVFKEVLSHGAHFVDTDLLFPGEPGKDGLRKPYEFTPMWSRIVRSMGIENLRFHDLRHEAVSRLVEVGLGDQEVAAISGHKSMQMLKRYTHLRAEDLVKRLDALIKQ